LKVWLFTLTIDGFRVDEHQHRANADTRTVTVKLDHSGFACPIMAARDHPGRCARAPTICSGNRDRLIGPQAENVRHASGADG
jgi:hypothetical protein